jgi:hypothetical protein
VTIFSGDHNVHPSNFLVLNKETLTSYSSKVCANSVGIYISPKSRQSCECENVRLEDDCRVPTWHGCLEGEETKPIIIVTVCTRNEHCAQSQLRLILGICQGMKQKRNDQDEHFQYYGFLRLVEQWASWVSGLS